MDRLQGQVVVGSTFPLDLDTLWLMGMVMHRSGHFILTSTIAQAPVESDNEDDDSDDEPDSESSLSLVIEPSSPCSLAVVPPRR